MKYETPKERIERCREQRAAFGTMTDCHTQREQRVVYCDPTLCRRDGDKLAEVIVVQFVRLFYFWVFQVCKRTVFGVLQQQSDVVHKHGRSRWWFLVLDVEVRQQQMISLGRRHDNPRFQRCGQTRIWRARCPRWHRHRCLLHQNCCLQSGLRRSLPCWICTSPCLPSYPHTILLQCEGVVWNPQTHTDTEREAEMLTSGGGNVMK